MSRADDLAVLSRWRLVLGRTAEEHGVTLAPGQGHERIDEVCDFLFDAEGGGAGDGAAKRGGGRRRDRKGGRGGGHPLTVPTWPSACTVDALTSSSIAPSSSELVTFTTRRT